MDDEKGYQTPSNSRSRSEDQSSSNSEDEEQEQDQQEELVLILIRLRTSTRDNEVQPSSVPRDHLSTSEQVISHPIENVSSSSTIAASDTEPQEPVDLSSSLPNWGLTGRRGRRSTIHLKEGKESINGNYRTEQSRLKGNNLVSEEDSSKGVFPAKKLRIDEGRYNDRIGDTTTVKAKKFLDKGKRKAVVESADVSGKSDFDYKNMNADESDTRYSDSRTDKSKLKAKNLVSRADLSGKKGIYQAKKLRIDEGRYDHRTSDTSVKANKLLDKGNRKAVVEPADVSGKSDFDYKNISAVESDTKYSDFRTDKSKLKSKNLVSGAYSSGKKGICPAKKLRIDEGKYNHRTSAGTVKTNKLLEEGKRKAVIEPGDVSGKSDFDYKNIGADESDMKYSDSRTEDSKLERKNSTGKKRCYPAKKLRIDEGKYNHRTSDTTVKTNKLLDKGKRKTVVEPGNVSGKSGTKYSDVKNSDPSIHRQEPLMSYKLPEGNSEHKKTESIRTHKCEYCGKCFPTAQGVGCHKRWCRLREASSVPEGSIQRGPNVLLFDINDLPPTENDDGNADS